MGGGLCNSGDCRYLNYIKMENKTKTPTCASVMKKLTSAAKKFKQMEDLFKCLDKHEEEIKTVIEADPSFERDVKNWKHRTIDVLR